MQMKTSRPRPPRPRNRRPKNEDENGDEDEEESVAVLARCVLSRRSGRRVQVPSITAANRSPRVLTRNSANPNASITAS